MSNSPSTHQNRLDGMSVLVDDTSWEVNGCRFSFPPTIDDLVLALGSGFRTIKNDQFLFHSWNNEIVAVFQEDSVHLLVFLTDDEPMGWKDSDVSIPFQGSLWLFGHSCSSTSSIRPCVEAILRQIGKEDYYEYDFKPEKSWCAISKGLFPRRSTHEIYNVIEFVERKPKQKQKRSTELWLLGRPDILGVSQVQYAFFPQKEPIVWDQLDMMLGERGIWGTLLQRRDFPDVILGLSDRRLIKKVGAVQTEVFYDEIESCKLQYTNRWHPRSLARMAKDLGGELLAVLFIAVMIFLAKNQLTGPFNEGRVFFQNFENQSDWVKAGVIIGIGVAGLAGMLFGIRYFIWVMRAIVCSARTYLDILLKNGSRTTWAWTPEFNEVIAPRGSGVSLLNKSGVAELWNGPQGIELERLVSIVDRIAKGERVDCRFWSLDRITEFRNQQSQVKLTKKGASPAPPNSSNGRVLVTSLQPIVDSVGWRTKLCSNCGYQFSRFADNCPRCHHPNSFWNKYNIVNKLIGGSSMFLLIGAIWKGNTLAIAFGVGGLVVTIGMGYLGCFLKWWYSNSNK